MQEGGYGHLGWIEIFDIFFLFSISHFRVTLELGSLAIYVSVLISFLLIQRFSIRFLILYFCFLRKPFIFLCNDSISCRY